MRQSFAVEEAVATLGANIKASRLRRRLPQSVVAERAGISVNTLSKLENGDCGITIGNVASVLNALGLISLLEELSTGEQDRVGLMLDERHLPKRIRTKKNDGDENP